MSKENRSEYVGIYVSPEFKAELDLVRDNDKLKDEMIKRYFEDEKGWIKEEIQEMDDIGIRYKASLLKIKDNFRKSQDAYQEEIEEMYTATSKTFSKVTSAVENLKKKTENTKDNLHQISQSIKYINTNPLERLVTIAERYGKLNQDEKDMIKMIISKQ